MVETNNSGGKTWLVVLSECGLYEIGQINCCWYQGLEKGLTEHVQSAFPSLITASLTYPDVSTSHLLQCL